jgi:hypothetical protein
MKNIHVLPTDKPSKLYAKDDNYKLANSTMAMDWYISSVGYKPYNIYITDNSKIREGDWFLNTLNNQVNKCDDLIYEKNVNLSSWCKKIILTTDEDLIKNGVQAIDDEFLEWFVKNPSCERVEVKEKQHFEADKSKRINPLNGVYYSYKIIIPKETLSYTEAAKKDERIFNSTMMKQETLEEAAEKWYDSTEENKGFPKIKAFKEGAKWQQEQDKNKYSEYEVKRILMKTGKYTKISLNVWFEQFKKK